MAVVAQLTAAAFEAVAKRKAQDQFSESAVVNYLAKKGGVRRMAPGRTWNVPLSYRANTGADFLADDFTSTGTSKTEVITEASYTPIMVVVPINISHYDEALSSGEQKISLATSLIENALASHDALIETGIFASSATDGFESLPTLITNDGTGTVGGIVAGTETWFKNQFKDYGDASTLVADLTTLVNACAKGSGGMTPNVIATNAADWGVLAGKYVSNQRFESATANVGIRLFKFMDADVIFSPDGVADKYFAFNTKSLQLYVARNCYRKLRKATEMEAAAADNQKVESICQLTTDNRSRSGVAFT